MGGPTTRTKGTFVAGVGYVPELKLITKIAARKEHSQSIKLVGNTYVLVLVRVTYS